MNDQQKKHNDTKTWKIAATFGTYKDADTERNRLLEVELLKDENERMLVKVHRRGKGGAVFGVKTWKPFVKKSKEKQTTKNGSNKTLRKKFKKNKRPKRDS